MAFDTISFVLVVISALFFPLQSRIQIIDEYKARVDNNNGTSNKTSNFLDVYDAVWSIAFVLEQSRTELLNMQGKVLENLTYGDANATALFRRYAVNLNFPSPNIGVRKFICYFSSYFVLPCVCTESKYHSDFDFSHV